LWITIVYALGTSSFSQSSQALWQHGGSQLAITATLYCVTRTEWDLRWSVIAGFAGAFAIVCRPTDAILMACLTIFVLFRFRKNFVGFVAGALVPVGFQFWYNVTYLGGPFRTQFPVWG